jgi:ribosomal protein L7/L12
MGEPTEESQRQWIQEALFAGRKIEAIKLFRELTGAELKEAKDFVDGLEARLRKEEPERFAKTTAGGGSGGALIAIVLGAAALALVWWLLLRR